MIDIPIRDQYKEVLTRTIAVYDTASKSSTSAYKQDKNNYYILALEQDWLVVFLQNSYISFTDAKVDHPSKYTGLLT